MIRHAWRTCLLLFVLLVLVACGGLQSNILGKWKEAGGGVMAFEFFKDGTMIMSALGREFPATYKLPQSDQVQILLSGDLGGREYLLTNVKVSNGRLSCSLVDYVNDQGVIIKSLEMIRTAASQNVSAGRTAGGALPWLPLIALGVLALGAIGIFFGFGRVAGIGETIQSGVSTGQWRVQALRSSNEQARLAKQRDQAVATLGAQAWQQRVQHPDYADTYIQLSALEEQRGQAQQELAALNADAQRETGTLNQIKADYGARIGAVQEKKNAATAQLRQLQAEHQAAGKRLADADKQQQTIGGDLRSMQDKLSRAQASTTSDRADRVALLTGGIVTLQRSSGDLAGQLPALQADVARLYEVQQPFAAEVAQHDQQLAELQAEQKAAVDPLNAQLSDLQARIRVANERLSAFVGQMTPLTAGLGGAVARARPEAPALAGVYGEVDRLDRELSGVTNQGNLLKARLAVVDSGALRKFYLLIGAALAVIVVVVALWSMGTAIPSSAPGGAANIVGRWQLTTTQGTWDYTWMQFFNDGTCTDSWGNNRTWTMLPDGRLKITAGFGAGTYLFNVNITGNKMEIADESGNRAVGTR